jgi:hypothetical protein
MRPCCPTSSAAAGEVASICTECGTATVAGASLSLPLLLTGLVAAGVVVIACRVLRCRLSVRASTAGPALA